MESPRGEKSVTMLEEQTESVMEKMEKMSDLHDIESRTEAPSHKPTYVYAVDMFRDQFHSSSSSKALERIRRELKNNANADSQLIRFITEGSVAFNNSLYSFWNNLMIVSMFMGVVSATISVGVTGRMAGFVDTTKVGPMPFEGVSRAFYVLWAISAVTQLSALLLVFVSSLQYKLMLHEDDMVWFLLNWGFLATKLPLLLISFGSLCAVAGVVVGVVITADILVTSVVAGISGLLLLLVFGIWVCMSSYNREKEQDAMDAIRRVLLKKL